MRRLLPARPRARSVSLSKPDSRSSVRPKRFSLFLLADSLLQVRRSVTLISLAGRTSTSRANLFATRTTRPTAGSWRTSGETFRRLIQPSKKRSASGTTRRARSIRQSPYAKRSRTLRRPPGCKTPNRTASRLARRPGRALPHRRCRVLPARRAGESVLLLPPRPSRLCRPASRRQQSIPTPGVKTCGICAWQLP